MNGVSDVLATLRYVLVVPVKGLQIGPAAGDAVEGRLGGEVKETLLSCEKGILLSPAQVAPLLADCEFLCRACTVEEGRRARAGLGG